MTAAATSLQAAINLQSALGFRGVSFDGILVIGTSRDDDKPGHQLKYQPTRIPDIILHAVKSNKYVAALGGGIRFLEDVFFKGVPILQGKHVAYMDGHADFYQASGATAVAGEELVRDRRLLTATYQVSPVALRVHTQSLAALGILDPVCLLTSRRL